MQLEGSNYQFVGLTPDEWEDVIDYISYSSQSAIASDEDELNGIQLIELIKEQIYEQKV